MNPYDHPYYQSLVAQTLAERARSRATLEAVQAPAPALLHGSAYQPPQRPSLEEQAKTLAAQLRPVPKRRV